MTRGDASSPEEQCKDQCPQAAIMMCNSRVKTISNWDLESVSECTKITGGYRSLQEVASGRRRPSLVIVFRTFESHGCRG